MCGLRLVIYAAALLTGLAGCATSCWPDATTVYDYIHRAMPFNAPGTLSPSEVYAVTAYLLNLNGIVPSNAIMNARTLPKVRLPNRNGFYQPDPRPDTRNKECMKNCLSNSRQRGNPSL